ncbi:MAG: hypothetical protein DRI74_06745 [Bacteroidetes bacterium]|nr:MAG: hypothetical protein DRI74_06745 [Bacteroidota bacterium]
MVKLLKLFRQDIGSRSGRFQIIAFFTRSIPGRFGFEIRRILWPRYFAKCGVGTIIHVGAHILNPEKLTVGNNVHIGAFTYLQAGGGISLEGNCLLGPYAKIWSQNHQFRDPNLFISEQGYEYKAVYIGADVWIGANAFVMPGANIGDRCIISACSVVGGKNILPNTILAGNPARKIGTRPT